ncbi:MAG: ABC transporter permease, partial [Treponema sp.]|nr:ABC transporter permease [Treponema sp.]
MSKDSKEQPPAERARKIKTPGAIYGWPMGAWFTLFFVVPLLLIILYSFLKRDVYGGIKLQFTLKAYKQMLSSSYGILFLRTLKISIISTLITILIALPCGYAIAR